jgi:hypothetical protein
MFTLDDVVPWGRSFDEYRRMFNLSERDLQGRILGCADGPASFNAEATRLGHRVVSCDPLYRFECSQVAGRIAATSGEVLEQTRKNQHEFVWDAIVSVEELGRVRADAMRRFVEDFESGKKCGRYVDAALPALPFPDGSFDLAVCSHFLFLYTEQLGEPFHFDALVELCRVAPEVRLFPMLALGGQPSRLVPIMSRRLRGAGHEVTIERVPYEFQRGGNEMMRIR